MRAAAATAGVVSAAVLLAPSCGGTGKNAGDADDLLRQASFRSLAARDFLMSCPGSGRRTETIRQTARLEELKQLAARKEAARSVWLGENDWAAVVRYSDREPCRAGEQAFRQALAAFSGTLDVLAARIAEYRP